jgi:ketosteroid isomerase-like protein
MTRPSLVALMITVVIGAACTQPAPAAPPPPPPPDPAAVRSAIESTNAKAVAAILAGDVTTATAHYADDAVVMMPNAPKATGRADIAGVFAGLLAEMSVKAATFTTSEVLVEGNMAVETGVYNMTMQLKKGGAEIKDTGKYLTVWKKQPDGSWKIIRDINNSDLPLTPPAK